MGSIEATADALAEVDLVITVDRRYPGLLDPRRAIVEHNRSVVEKAARGVTAVQEGNHR